MKRFLIFAVLVALLCFAGSVSAELNNIRGEGVDGNLVFKDPSGNHITKWDATDASFSVPGNTKTYTPTALTFVAGSGYSISDSQIGSVFTVNVATATISNATPSGPGNLGVTVIPPTPTAANDKRVIGIQNIGTAGVTPIIIRNGSLPIASATGVSWWGGKSPGDITWVQLNYNNAVSYYVVGEFKRAFNVSTY